MNTHCPVCGRPFSTLEQLLAERDASYQCRHCWNRVGAFDVKKTKPQARAKKRIRMPEKRHAA